MKVIETTMRRLFVVTTIMAAFVCGGSLTMGGFIRYVAAPEPATKAERMHNDQFADLVRASLSR
ncbi:MAG: hypothetical protein ACKVH0_07260 [Alphaproteobacteria bacterium]|jgi:hypothetical protein